MITINKLTAEVAAKSRQLDEDGHTMRKSEKTKIANRIAFLRQTIAYLEQDNREEFLKGELERLQKRKDLIQKDYVNWIPNKYFEKEKHKITEYYKEMGIPKLNSQIKALRFILDI